MNNNIGRFIITLIIIIATQLVLGWLLAMVGISGIYAILLMSLAMAILFAYLNYPPQLRRYAVKDPHFHKMIAIFFVVFFLIDFLF